MNAPGRWRVATTDFLSAFLIFFGGAVAGSFALFYLRGWGAESLAEGPAAVEAVSRVPLYAMAVPLALLVLPGLRRVGRIRALFATGARTVGSVTRLGSAKGTVTLTVRYGFEGREHVRTWGFLGTARVCALKPGTPVTVLLVSPFPRNAVVVEAYLGAGPARGPQV